MVYKVIYKSFVINNKYNEVLVLIIKILNIIKKKKRENKFKLSTIIFYFHKYKKINY